jgi:hypothetical protein
VLSEDVGSALNYGGFLSNKNRKFFPGLHLKDVTKSTVITPSCCEALNHVQSTPFYIKQTVVHELLNNPSLLLKEIKTHVKHNTFNGGQLFSLGKDGKLTLLPYIETSLFKNGFYNEYNILMGNVIKLIYSLLLAVCFKDYLIYST